MIKKTNFKDLLVIQNTLFKDKRGYLKELLKERELKKKFPFTVMSFSKKNVIRGLHLQNKNSQGKFISVLKGKIFDVAVDLRRKSKTYGKYFSIILSEKNSKSLRKINYHQVKLREIYFWTILFIFPQLS